MWASSKFPTEIDLNASAVRSFPFVLCALTLACTAAPQVKADLPDGPERELVAARCVVCHDISVITTQRHNADDWRNTVQRMAAQGAQVSPEEIDQIIDYLSTYLGLTPPP